MWYLKSWLSLSPGATTSVLYDPVSLNLPSMTLLYTECHAFSYAQLSLSPDTVVRSALEFKVQITLPPTNANSTLQLLTNLCPPFYNPPLTSPHLPNTTLKLNV